MENTTEGQKKKALIKHLVDTLMLQNAKSEDQNKETQTFWKSRMDAYRTKRIHLINQINNLFKLKGDDKIPTNPSIEEIKRKFGEDHPDLFSKPSSTYSYQSDPEEDTTVTRDGIIEVYNKMFMENGRYKEGYAKPEKVSDNTTNLKIPTPKALEDFTRALAEKGYDCTVINQDGEVLARTNNGMLWHPTEDRKLEENELFSKGAFKSPAEEKTAAPPEEDEIPSSLQRP